MFSKYYQSELTYLRELGREFAAAHPALAGLLAERGGDPDVERLLEGFAFLTARIRERVDDAVPDIVHGLCELLLPHYLRTIPACSIVEFQPMKGALRGRQTLPRGTEVAATTVDETSCRFRTTAEVDLLPLEIEDVVLDQTSVIAPVLRIRCKTTEAGIGQVFQPAGIRFHLHGELVTAQMMFLWLLRFCRGITVRGLSGKTTPVQLPSSAIVPTGFSPDAALVPWPALAPEGYRHIQEYFTLPAKFLFFDVVGLERAESGAEEKFELAFQFERPPELPARFAKDAVRLHCAPVVNLFQTAADPVSRQAFSAEGMLRASEMDPAHMEIYSVDSVVGLHGGRRGRRTYRPFFDFMHSAPGAEEVAYFRLRRSISPVDDGIDTFIGIATARDVSKDTFDETLSIDLTCNNRSLPSKLRIGDISVPTTNSPTTAKFSNIAPVTTAIRPPLGSELHWRLLSHLALNQRSLADAASLRALLELYNFQSLGDERAGRANRLRTEAILRVSMQPIKRLMKNTPMWGQRTLLELEEGSFTGKGDAFLFGAIIDELLATNVTINSFSELSVRLQPSQSEYTWTARNGQTSIL